MKYCDDPFDPISIIIRQCLRLSPTAELRAAVVTVYNPARTMWLIDGYTPGSAADCPSIAGLLQQPFFVVTMTA